jgi:anti-sigma factor RsiW
VIDLVCRTGVNHLMDYLEGVVDPALGAALEHHAAGCPKCQAFIASYQATPRIVREATTVTAPEGLASWIFNCVREGEK